MTVGHTAEVRSRGGLADAHGTTSRREDTGPVAVPAASAAAGPAKPSRGPPRPHRRPSARIRAGRRTGAAVVTLRRPADGDDQAGATRSTAATQRRRTAHGLGPRIISYSMGPAAFVILLVLRHLGLVAHLPVVIYVAIFAGMPAVSTFLESFYRRNPNRLRLHMRVAFHTASVTTVIYLTGWGPVVIGAYAFVALENIANSGSRTWRIAAFWSLVGIAIGQLGIWQGWVPSFLDLAKAETLGLMGAFVLVFVIRMAGATSEQKEDAESSLRTSEERFRSLVQNSSDTTLLLGPAGVILYASPATRSLLGREPDELSACAPRSSSIPTTGPGSSRSWSSCCAPRRSSSPSNSASSTATAAGATPRPSSPTCASARRSGGYVINVRDITERKEAEEKLAHQALHDPLTGLPNRVLLVDRLRNAIARGPAPRRTARRW